MIKQSKSNDVFLATNKDIKSVECIKRNEFSYRYCNAPGCWNTSKTALVYKVIFNRPMHCEGFAAKYNSWKFCERHLPSGIKDAPQIKIALFAARAKGRG